MHILEGYGVVSEDRTAIGARSLPWKLGDLLGRFFFPYLALALVLQFLSGAYQSEMGHWPDEPSHVTTALMVRDYLASNFAAPPLQYAENYYVHYPKVALGMWPPAFYGVAALWMLMFGATRLSLLILLATAAALFSATLALFARRVFGALTGFALGLLLILMPLIQSETSTIMLDIPVAVIQLWALMLLIRFFRTGQTRDAAAFGAMTALAMLTKGNANALVFVLLFLLVFTGRYDLLKRPGLYLSGLIVLVIGMPWQLLSLKVLQRSVPMADVDLIYATKKFVAYTRILYEQVGVSIFLFAVFGFLAVCVKLLRNRKIVPLELTAAASLLAAVLVFHSIAPNSDPDARYMTTALPVLLLFFAAGVAAAARLLTARLSLAARLAILAGPCLLLFAGTTFAIPPRPQQGFMRAAELFSVPDRKNDIVLVCSDAGGEGAFIVEMALKDSRPQHIVLRTSKVISDNPWTPRRRRPVLNTEGEVSDFLDSIPVTAVVVDQTSALWEEDRAVLLEALQRNSSKWSLISDIPASKHSRHISVYRRTDAPQTRGTHIRIPMKHTLGYDLIFKRE
jgi:hypothetical protein